jgi:membrane protein implicated in regulation of membrane protease activity
MSDFFSKITDWQWWTMLGVMLIILEMLTTSFYVSIFGLAALLTAGVAASGAGFVWQMAAFVLASVAGLMFVRPVIKRLFYRATDTRTHNVSSLAGQVGLVSETIPGQNLPGRVKLAGEEWRALHVENSPLAEGTVVQVINAQGATLMVKCSD